MPETTPQPSMPFEEGGEWFFTFYTLKGPRKIGPYPDEQSALNESNKAVRLHAANGYTDGDVWV